MSNSTNIEQVKREVLVKLYDSFCVSYDGHNLRAWLDQEKWDRTAFWNLIDRMSDEELLRGRPGGFYMLSPRGVRHVEKMGLAPEELLKKNHRCRTDILLFLTTIYEGQGALHSALTSELRDQSSDPELVTANLLVLIDSGHVERFGNGGFKITYVGLDAVEEYRGRVSVADEFERISLMNPQARGRSLQKLLARLVEQNGWDQEEGARTSNEEMDVVVSRQREYYVLECKWEKDPIEAPVVRELFGKLNNRADVRGILVSMSGFSKGAVKQVHDYVGHRVILMFGGNDIKSLISGNNTFDELLNARYKELVVRRNVEFT